MHVQFVKDVRIGETIGPQEGPQELRFVAAEARNNLNVYCLYK